MLISNINKDIILTRVVKRQRNSRGNQILNSNCQFVCVKFMSSMSDHNNNNDDAGADNTCSSLNIYVPAN